MDPAFVCAGDLFREDSDGEESADAGFVEREHSFPEMTLKVREFMFHQVNANLLWPGSTIFAQWLVEHRELVEGSRVLELGSGTGALAIFLKKSLAVDITTCDYDDDEIEANIAHNCKLNGMAPVPHIRHTWGERFPADAPAWELVIASDILLYVKQYPNLVKTLKFLLASDRDSRKLPLSRKPCFVMSWRRRIPKEDEALFFADCGNAGFQVEDLGSRVYRITA
ncbi:methyltransferase-like protein 23 [Selaginella moellendorffii]|nr:methyltransferase-like protein 23 [Selaginella moellendorffii]XP_024529198.1 methyltransferase-like protein 23 [Selaginella moellendorffii]|eukprot:XP_002968461.2 methyltransferase-like protein 23 [Selaginella moellendorffii]